MKEENLTGLEFYNSSETYLDILEHRNESDFSAILEVLTSYIAAGATLDYGCGVGLLSMLLARHGYTVTGVDISEQFIRSARKNFGVLLPITFEVIDGLPLRFSDGSFDSIVTSSVLEHCTGVDAILLEFKRLLKSKGFLVIETPNMLSPLTRVRLIVDRLTGKRKKFHRYGTPRFLLFSVYKLLRKIILRKSEFVYVKPDYSIFSETDDDVTYLSNHLDYLFFLRTHGFDVLELSRNKGIIRKRISKYFPSIAGGVMIVARKK
jgi:2-polyprenyl-3-methyl-5-hydroxy-6-metoxy-1,4-benzoquinol methylase